MERYDWKVSLCIELDSLRKQHNDLVTCLNHTKKYPFLALDVNHSDGKEEIECASFPHYLCSVGPKGIQVSCKKFSYRGYGLTMLLLSTNHLFRPTFQNLGAFPYPPKPY
jgi:hypothetical protein